MMPPEQYELLDFGENEKLESFAGTVVRRETPSAPGSRSAHAGWEQPKLWGSSVTGSTRWKGVPPDPWSLDFGQFQLILKPTPTGQVGVFPEQASNWEWIQNLPKNLAGLRAINLFAYTGATTLALARRGVHVAHVDGAKSVVNWARSNAAQSAMSDFPIRWIVEDAMTFVQREIKRGNQYDIVVADPPSFGRGPKGEFWKIQRDVESLFESFSPLTAGQCQMMIVSCHTPGIDYRSLESIAQRFVKLGGGKTEGFELSLTSSTGKRLPSGSCFRWASE